MLIIPQGGTIVKFPLSFLGVFQILRVTVSVSAFLKLARTLGKQEAWPKADCEGEEPFSVTSRLADCQITLTA